jgi:hypothetical protein
MREGGRIYTCIVFCILIFAIGYFSKHHTSSGHIFNVVPRYNLIHAISNKVFSSTSPIYRRLNPRENQRFLAKIKSSLFQLTQQSDRHLQRFSFQFVMLANLSVIPYLIRNPDIMKIFSDKLISLNLFTLIIPPKISLKHSSAILICN